MMPPCLMITRDIGKMLHMEPNRVMSLVRSGAAAVLR